MKVTITPAMLASAKTEAGGYTRAQLKVLGIDWPPPKGWAKALVGQDIEESLYQQFMDTRSVTSNPAPKQDSLF